MAHLEKGLDCPHLREPIVKMILRGQAHMDSLKDNLESKKQRLPVTIPILKYIQYKIKKKLNWTPHKKATVWAVSTLLWNGSMRVHEALSKEKLNYDPTTTLLHEDVNVCNTVINKKRQKLLKIKLKCPKESSVGNGVVIVVFQNKTFLCPMKALKIYLNNCACKLEPKKPLFRTETGGCYTGRQFNKDLAEITSEVTEGTSGVIRSHSFRSGVATEMGLREAAIK